MVARTFLLGLIILLIVLQYRLWFAEGGLGESARLQAEIEKQTLINKELQERNEKLVNQVLELQHGLEMLEAVAREELGLIREGEEFFLFDETREDGSR